MIRKRVIAFMIDVLIIGFVGLLLTRFGQIDLGTMPYLMFYPELVRYPIFLLFLFFIYEFLSNILVKQTIGHAVMNLKIKYEQPSLIHVYIRSMIKVLSVVTIFLASYSLYLLKENKTFHDLLARSQVWTD